LSPLRYYWDQRFRKQINEVYFDKGKTIKAKEMMNLKKTFNDSSNSFATKKHLALMTIKTISERTSLKV